jgi:phage-related protein
MIYRIDVDAIVLVEVFAKKSRQTPKRIMESCRQRLSAYDVIVGGDAHG